MCIHSSVGGHLGSSYLLAVVNKSSVNVSVQVVGFFVKAAIVTSPLEWTALFPWGGVVLGPAGRVSAGGVHGILKMPFWCLDTTTGLWHSRENVCTVLPSPRFARKDAEGQREHGEGDIGVYGHNLHLCK